MTKIGSVSNRACSQNITNIRPGAEYTPDKLVSGKLIRQLNEYSVYPFRVILRWDSM
jgi:hypothetical protein